MSNSPLRMLNELSFIGQSGLEVWDLSSNEMEHISNNTSTHVLRLKWVSLKNDEPKIPDNTPLLENVNMQVLHIENCSLNIILLSSFVGFVNPYPTAFPYGNGMVLHFYQQQESSTTKTAHKVINKRLKAYV